MKKNHSFSIGILLSLALVSLTEADKQLFRIQNKDQQTCLHHKAGEQQPSMKNSDSMNNNVWWAVQAQEKYTQIKSIATNACLAMDFRNNWSCFCANHLIICTEKMTVGIS